jgi:hypothetical protein
MSKKIIWISSLFLITFIGLGYLWSDDLYFKRLVQKNQLTSPNRVYQWVSANYISYSCVITHPYASPRHLIENHKRLWCDEGAMVAAVLNNQLGYKTKLADFYGLDGIAHHTILRTYYQNRGHNYDFSFHLTDQSYARSVIAGKIEVRKIITRPYPKMYNVIINHNYFIKKVVFFLRGIREDDFVN